MTMIESTVPFAISESPLVGTLERFTAGIPGIYRGIPADMYHGLCHCSFSRLARLNRSPLHCCEPLYVCPYCGHTADWQGCDYAGAEPGGAFCNKCNREFYAW